jgi:hypothetical protein
MMASIATIVFSAALLIQGGTMLSEYAQIIFPAGSRATNVEGFGGSTCPSSSSSALPASFLACFRCSALSLQR